MTTLIGLTGGIACGKSAVSMRLAQRGALIVDADQIARNILVPGSEGLEQVVARWGTELLSPTGELDRTKLGAIVFAQAEERQALEGITHPLIAQESQRQLTRALSQKPPLVVYDAALLVEAGRTEMFRPLVVVTSTPILQRQRIMARDGLDEAQAQARMDAQLPLSQKEALADHVIRNDGDWAQLDAQIDALWTALL